MLVSIIIPIYNVVEFICDCLDSVYNQTYSNIEVILVDDCTPDNSMKVAEPFIQRLRQRFTVQVIRHEHNRGLSAARNSAIKVMNGDWIYLLDSDDEIVPECIELMIKPIRKYPVLDFIISEMKVVGSNALYPLNCNSYLNNNLDILNAYIYGQWYVMACNKLIRSDFFIDKCLWFEEGLLHEDELFSFYLAVSANYMATVNYPTYIYKVRTKGSITAECKIDNLEHCICINRKIFKYVTQNIKPNNEACIGRFIVNVTYSFLMTVLANSNVSIGEKKHLIKEQLSMYCEMKNYLRKDDMSQFIKRILLSFPNKLLLFSLSVHLKYLNK